MLLPVGILALLQAIINYRPFFFLMVAAIPISISLEVGTLSLDLPSEPLMILFLFLLLFLGIGNKLSIQGVRLYPFHILIFLILFWLVFTTINSAVFLRSLKFLLAKLWYIGAFVYISEHIIRKPDDLRKIFWAFFIPFLGVMFTITIWHALEGFSFESSHNIVYPLFPNAVIYGATLALFIPFIWGAMLWYSPKKVEWYIILGGLLLALLGIIFSYKRGAWLAVFMLPFISLAVIRKWFDWSVYLMMICSVFTISYLLHNNNFYKYAPNYEQTIFHHGNLEGHLEATFQGKELSSMERFYRWVAAKNMIAAKPLAGFGPSTFNQVYKGYADDAFRTYVSDNPEQSTTHNYFLMTFSEQGIIGGLLFLGLCLYMLLKAYYLYHRISDPFCRNMALVCLLSLSTIIFHNLLNEMIEVDKVGAMFWLVLTIIHKLEVWEDQQTI